MEYLYNYSVMAKRKEKKLIVVIPADLHKRLKVMSAVTGNSMKDIVTNVLTATIKPYSSTLEKLKSKKKAAKK